MFSFFKSILNYNEKEIRRIQVMVDVMNSHEEAVRKLKDADFPKETEQLKSALQDGTKTVSEILPWAYALVREASRRTLDKRHYDVQLVAAVALHEGKVIEQKTGEGKTLTATPALYLNALEGKGAHLVTVNDYLARRDAGWMGVIFHFLGLKTSAIISSQSLLYDPEYTDPESHDSRLSHLRPISRKEAYDADITYGINSEFGFDYLRDNMTQMPTDLVQRGFHYAIVDEADSVLIDEARTPHIISAPVDQDISKYYGYADIVRKLDEKTDYVIDEKLRTAHLTDAGISKIESIIGVKNIYEQDFDTLFYIEAALKASTLFRNDKDYIVRGSEVVIVDEFTGRLLEGRRFSEGLHQAIEAKEGVAIKQESRTLATVSLQNYFRGYKKLAGMTGTALTEAEEFSKIYKTDVLVIPTHRTMIRKDHADMIYKTEKAKFNAVVDAIAEAYKAGRPVLVGTTSIEKNEYVSMLLRKRNIPHQLLNAKNHEQEAEIISQAGKKRGVMVATNMAGRGVDIVLGGDIQRENFDSDTAYNKALTAWEKEHQEVLHAGGLLVIGTERHESRRIDNQLRGRSGRQGDPGETIFYVSLEDDVMRIFGGEQISKLMTMLNFPEDQPLSHSLVSRAIEQAQVKVEGFNFDIRKHLVDFDDVLNKQRDIIYSLRRKILLYPEADPVEFQETVYSIIDEQISAMSASYFAIAGSMPEEQEQFEKDIAILFDIEPKDILPYVENRDEEGFQDFLYTQAEKKFEVRVKDLGAELWNQVVRSIFLSSIDQYWTQHLTAIDDLREGINLRGYAQMDPLIEYKNEAFKLFEKLLSDVYYESVRRVMNVEVTLNAPEEMPKQEKKQKQLRYESASAVDPFTGKKKKQPSQSTEEKPAHGLNRNDPCPCGSGKKWKKCHYPNIP